jgi:hypothetical protein
MKRADVSTPRSRRYQFLGTIIGVFFNIIILPSVCTFLGFLFWYHTNLIPEIYHFTLFGYAISTSLIGLLVSIFVISVIVCKWLYENKEIAAGLEGIVGLLEIFSIFGD